VGLSVQRLREALHGLRELVHRQAEDDGLWFDARYVTEAYLQQELRKLHAAIEAVTNDLGPAGEHDSPGPRTLEP
jgi:hypothetical protein